MRAALVAVGLFLACVAPAWAAPARVQIGSGCSTTSCSLATGAPANGDIVSWIVPNTAAVSGVTVKDSNGLSLTEHQPSGNCDAGSVLCVAIFDYVVSGSPTATYTLTGITAYENCTLSPVGVEISGAVYGSAVYATTNSASGTSLIATLSGVANTDFQGGNLFCLVNGGNATMVLSNGTNFAWGSNAGKTALAIATASSTARGTATAFTNAVVAYVDYPALGGGGGSSTCGPYPWPCLFQPG